MQSFGLDQLTTLSEAQSRSITAENPDGAAGAGGQAENHLGEGRKGRPCLRDVESGATRQLADIEGPGVVNHIWITVPQETDGGDYVLRDLVLRMYWDGEDDPSVEVPLGDFFCNGHAMRCNVNSLPVVVAPVGGFNSYWPMPFHERARIMVENEHPEPLPVLFYQIDYSLVPELEQDTAHFHAQWRRENPTTRAEDYTVVDDVDGEGHYVGTYLAWTALEDHWWGEGEMKAYVDGDEEHPTICGTGTEDYVGGAWCFGEPETYSTPFLGYPLHDEGRESHSRPPRHGLYRWHVPDPIRFDESIRVTIQQIGHDGHGLFERSDDVASVAYWYQTEPHTPFPKLPDADGRRPR
jgi:hypothetical protein